MTGYRSNQDESKLENLSWNLITAIITIVLPLNPMR